MEYQAILVLLLPLLGVVVGAGLQHFWGRVLEARKQLILQKSQSYADYFKAISLLAKGNSKEDVISLAADAKTRMCLYGSSEVIDNLNKFENAGASTALPEARNVFVDLVKSMRKDMGWRDDVENSSLKKILFGESDADSK